MLSEPRKLRTKRGYGYLVGRRDRLRVDSEHQAREMARRLMDGPGNEETLRAGYGIGAGTSRDEIEEWLATALAAGSMQPVRTKRKPRPLDTPKITDLVDLITDGEQFSDHVGTHWISFELVDRSEKPLRASFTVTVNGGPVRRGYLPEDGKYRHTGLEDGSASSVTLTDFSISGGRHGRRGGDTIPVAPPVGPRTLPGEAHYISFEVQDASGKPIPIRFGLSTTTADEPLQDLAAGETHRAQVDGNSTVTLSLEPIE